MTDEPTVDLGFPFLVIPDGSDYLLNLDNAARNADGKAVRFQIAQLEVRGHAAIDGSYLRVTDVQEASA